MRLYNSFLIRCWLVEDRPQNERAAFEVEHIQTGEHLRTTNLTEACDWMTSACRTARPGGRLSAPHAGRESDNEQ
ncbi:MAG TPA: hypothetical protein VFD58_05615 [Blastocatellia bacterium]|nr:hypothetical protein [Blastocatellia bacterium]